MLRAFRLTRHLGHLGTHIRVVKQQPTHNHHIYCYFSLFKNKSWMCDAATAATHSHFSITKVTTVILCKSSLALLWRRQCAKNHMKAKKKKKEDEENRKIWCAVCISVHIKLSYEFIRRVHRIYYIAIAIARYSLCGHIISMWNCEHTQFIAIVSEACVDYCCCNSNIEIKFLIIVNFPCDSMPTAFDWARLRHRQWLNSERISKRIYYCSLFDRKRSSKVF